jgi:hypothetical protein
MKGLPLDNLELLKKAVERLPPEELSKFREWFEKLQARLWDAQIERDVAAGKLDWLAQEARAEDSLPMPKKRR